MALRWRASGEERVLGFVNSWATTCGGTHVVGLREGLASAVDDHVKDRHLTAEDVCAGLTAVVSVKLDAPVLEGATRRVLGNTGVRACVAEAVREHVGAWLAEHPEHAPAVVRRT